MCGLFGLSGKFSDKQKQELLTQLSYSSTIRGEDATGFAFWEKKEVSILKKAISAQKFNLPSDINASLVLGHTRFATCGDPRSDDQAHPFISYCGDFVLAHNGVAYEDYQSIKKTYNLDCQTPVDSEGILRFLELNNCSLSQIEALFKEWTNSSFAVSLLNVKTGTLSLFHNNRMPLFFIELKSGVVYASTFDILAEALFNSQVDFNPLDIVEIPPFVVVEVVGKKISATELELPQEIKDIHLSFGKEDEYEE